jgi:nucleolar protein 6
MTITKKGSDYSRADRKAKKRKLEDAIPDLPGDREAVEITPADDKSSKKRKRAPGDTEAKEVVNDKERKSAKKEQKRRRVEKETALTLPPGNEETVKKSKKGKKESIADEASEETPAQSKGAPEIEEAPKKSKKERKTERKAREAAEKAANQAVVKPEEDTKATLEHEPTGSVNPASSGDKKPKKNNRNREKKRKASLENGAEGKAPRFIAFIGMSLSMAIRCAVAHRERESAL